MCDRTEQFAQSTGHFDGCIPRTVLNGLDVLPDDVLSEIFVIAATSLEEKVALSLVCKRFRGVMMSMRKMWDEYWVESTQSPEQIIAIAEGHRFVSLKAHIHKPSHDSPPSHVEAWVAKRRLDLTDYTPRYHYTLRYQKFSVGLILSYCPEELVFDVLGDRDLEEIRPILAGANLQTLRSLVMSSWINDRSLRRWHMPLLQNLEVDDFVPRPVYAGNLVRWRCRLIITREHQIYSLREFLKAAVSLQDLQLELYLYHMQPFYDVYELPSLRSLVVNFVPHLSFARQLIRFKLNSTSDWDISLPMLLDFLSSSDALEELTIAFDDFPEGPDAADALPVVTMPSVVSCQLLSYKMSATLIAKLHMPNLRTLRLYLSRHESTITRNEFRTSLQSMSSLEELELMQSNVSVADLDEIIRYAPPHLESFSLKECSFSATGEVYWNTPLAPSRNLIHFKECYPFKGDFVDYLRAIGLSRMKIQFDDCARWTNGTFGLDEVMSATVT